MSVRERQWFDGVSKLLQKCRCRCVWREQESIARKTNGLFGCERRLSLQLGIAIPADFEVAWHHFIAHCTRLLPDDAITMAALGTVSVNLLTAKVVAAFAAENHAFGGRDARGTGLQLVVRTIANRVAECFEDRGICIVVDPDNELHAAGKCASGFCGDVAVNAFFCECIQEAPNESTVAGAEEGFHKRALAEAILHGANVPCRFAPPN
jgi:hypothetical protein